MRKAFVVWLVTRTLLPCASKWPTRLPMVWVFPVPGGPCTRTPPCSSSCLAIRICSGFAGLLKRTSASVWPPPPSGLSAYPASGIGDSSPPMFRSRAIEQRMKSFPLQLFAAASDRAPVHVSHRLEQSGVKLGRMVGFREREFGYRSVELQLKALKKYGVVDAALGAAPAQNAVPQNKLDAFGLAIDAAVQRVKRLEDFHASTSGLFIFCPFIAEGLPALKRRGSCGAVGESRNSRFDLFLGLGPGFEDGDPA